VFERFYRVDPARSRDTGGSGLGLSIVKHVAADHGGDVQVWSQPGRGSTFTLRLPVAVGQPPVAAPDDRPQTLVVPDRPGPDAPRAAAAHPDTAPEA
jgi:two-component system sensor histidine kinase SenX3